MTSLDGVLLSAHLIGDAQFAGVVVGVGVSVGVSVGIGASGSSPLRDIAGAASGDDRKRISACAPEGFLALVLMPPENTMYRCTSAGKLPATVNPFTGNSSTVC